MKKIKALVLTPLLFAMYGCSSDDSSTPAAKPVTSGLFLDAEVEGLSYTSSSGVNGVTDENGTYEYRDGDTVSFSVGGVNIGSVPGEPVCTPFDFATASTNIARFLQSLDADGDPTNGIDIVDANTALAGTTVSSDAFLADTATFEANTDITGAIGTAGGTLIAEQDAIDNLAAGTDTTFENPELANNLFVVLDPVYNDIGVMSFSGTGPGTVESVFPEDTTAAGSTGEAYEETWVIDVDGVLTLTDPESFVTKVNRIGGSSRSISITYSENGAAPAPATLLIPRAVTPAELGGDGIDILSKTYTANDGVDTFDIVFDSTGGFEILDGSNDTGFYSIGDLNDNVIAIRNDEIPVVGSNMTFIIMLDAFPLAVDASASILIVDATIASGTNISNFTFTFDALSVGSIKLKSTEAAPVI